MVSIKFYINDGALLVEVVFDCFVPVASLLPRILRGRGPGCRRLASCRQHRPSLPPQLHSSSQLMTISTVLLTTKL